MQAGGQGFESPLLHHLSSYRRREGGAEGQTRRGGHTKNLQNFSRKKPAETQESRPPARPLLRRSLTNEVFSTATARFSAPPPPQHHRGQGGGTTRVRLFVFSGVFAREDTAEEGRVPARAGGCVRKKCVCERRSPHAKAGSCVSARAPLVL